MHTYIASITDLDDTTSKACSKLTGKDPLTFYVGIQYLFVAYQYNANAILAFLMKNRIDAEFA